MTNIRNFSLINYHKGYTLIEILVALTILAVIFSYGFVSFRDFSRRQAIEATKRRLEGELRNTQELTFSGRKPDDPNCNSPNTLNGYNFKVLSSSTYAIEAVCTGGIVQVKTGEVGLDTMISTPSPNPILFKVLGKGTNIGAQVATLTITQKGTTNTQAIIISSGGEIN